jgi:HSP20 family protein
MTLVRWSPTRELASMEIDRLNRMLDNGWMPPVDIFETKEREFVIKAELPDMKREDINLTLDNNVLTLMGERLSEFDGSTGTIHRTERAHGKFVRSFTLPATIDGGRINASYKDGVLTVRIPQREEVKPKQIAVGE